MAQDNPLSSQLRVLTPDGRPSDEQPKWRKDFPIDTAQDNYVARRDFTKFMVLISGSFVAGQAWIALKTLGGKPTGPGPRAIAEVRDIAIGQAATFSYPGEHDVCLLVRAGEEEFLAYSNKCSHLSCPVTPDVGSGRLLCPCHHGSFDLATGRPLAGPPRRPLARIVLEVRDGTIYATDVEERTV
ncbi:MAG: ubiquinol-cytochrome c reductase iron-sulfur subunit [Phycisphaerae bacterium]|jgi:Rieske Fe-S protein|nr:ubiquinol-cytochrome c reductase iron-sulfur subunit [Phycisphaerae bacterium]